MNTKSMILCIALWAIPLLVSCSKTGPADELRIEFHPAVETKGYIAGEEDPIFRNTGFSVFGSKIHNSGTPVIFMDNIKVAYASKWDYTGDYYWSPKSTHHFFAVYPYSEKESGKYSYSYNYNTQSVTVTETAAEDTDIDAGNGALEDIMYGYVSRDYQIGDPVTPVELQFEHACAAITIKIRNASEISVNEIVNIGLTNIYRSATSLQLTPTNAVWNGAATGVAISITGGNIFNMPTGNLEYKAFLNEEIIIPQDFTDARDELSKIKLAFTVKFSGSAEKDYEITLSDIPLPNGNAADNYKYLAGKHYTYNLDITGTKIAFSVDVEDWTKDEPIKLK